MSASRSTASRRSSPGGSPPRGPRWIHVVDLDGARAGLIRPVVVGALVHASAPASVQASGGVRSVADAETLVRAGASRVVVGTAAWTLLDELVASLGERLVVALDVRDGVVRTRGWTESGLELDEAIDRCVAAGVSRLLCTAIERDGTLEGPDVELVRGVVERPACPCSPPEGSARTTTSTRSSRPARRARSSAAPSSKAGSRSTRATAARARARPQRRRPCSARSREPRSRPATGGRPHGHGRS